MVPYCDKLLYYEYTQTCHYNDIVHLNSKKIGREKKRQRETKMGEDFHGKWDLAKLLTKPSFL